MAVASRNTDTYVGKAWTNTVYPEADGLGLSMIWPLTRDAIPSYDRVVADFSGYATYSTDGTIIYPLYQSPLRSSIVGTLKLNPAYTRGVYYHAVGTDYVCCTDVEAQEVRVASTANSGLTWSVSPDLWATIGGQEPIGMFVHEQLVGSPDPRIVIMTQNKVAYSVPYPSSAQATFTTATGYGGTMYGAAYSISDRLLTAVGVGGQVRYSADAMAWSSTLVTGTFSSNTFRSVVWSGDETVCLAVGDGGALAVSPDGINFSSSNALTTAGFTGRPGVIIRGLGPADFFMVAPNGTIAYTTNYGVSWTLYLNKFSLVQTVDTGVNDTPVTAWIYDAGMGFDALFISGYGGQLFTQTLVTFFSPTPPAMTNQSNVFSGYYTTFNTADVTGIWSKLPYVVSAASEPVVYMTGGQGRLMYMTDQATPWPTYDLTLLNWLQANGYTSDISTAVHYNRLTTQVVVGLTNGRVAYRTVPATPTSWTLDTLPGVTSKIIGIELTGTTYVAIAEDGSIGYGTPSGGGIISWSVSTTLKSLISSAVCCNLLYKTSGGPFPAGYMVSLASSSGAAYSPDLVTWSVSSIGSEFALLPMLVDANEVDVYGTPTWRWFYFLSTPFGSSSDAVVYTTFDNVTWSSVGDAKANEITGMFTFGSPKISMAIGSDGIGSISLDPTTFGSWGSSMGVTNQFAPPSAPGWYYLPPTTITKTVGTTLTTLSRNLAVSAGNRGRVWVSADPAYFP